MGARKRIRAEKIKEANKSIAFAKLNNSPIAPRKMRLVADLVRGVEVNKAHHHVLETEYSWTSFWQSELEFHISDKEDTPLDWEKTEFQNQIQIADFKNLNKTERRSFFGETNSE